jgi:hypothetical protein
MSEGRLRTLERMLVPIMKLVQTVYKWWVHHMVGGYTIAQIEPLEGIPLCKRLLPNLFASSVLFVLLPKDNG